jgi:hypothetical protein
MSIAKWFFASTLSKGADSKASYTVQCRAGYREASKLAHVGHISHSCRMEVATHNARQTPIHSRMVYHLDEMGE